MEPSFDYVLVGGGLQNALAALAIFDARPLARVALVEREPRLGGNHTWSFHAGDVPDAARAWVDPLVVARWPAWDVRFPRLRRTFDAPYASISSDRLHDVVTGAFERRAGSALHLGAEVTRVEARRVALRSGVELTAHVVVDARGPIAPGVARGELPCAWQKFLGLELRVRSAAPVPRPIVMDATVAQLDGFEFVYTLPLAPDRVLVEATSYSTSDALALPALRGGVLRYAASLGLDVEDVVREETGRLPLPLARDATPIAAGPLVAGYGGGFFHPTTGYSFAAAVRVAAHLASTHTDDVFGDGFRRLVQRHDRQARFAILLNRLLFEATPPDRRRDVLERFHDLPEPIVRRFYALDTTAADRARIVCGRPPRGVSLRAALAQWVRS